MRKEFKLEEMMLLYYKSDKENTIDLIKINKELKELDFFFTKKLEEYISNIINSSENKEKVELDQNEFLEKINREKEKGAINVGLEVFLGYKYFLENIKNIFDLEEIEEEIYQLINEDLGVFLEKSKILIIETDLNNVGIMEESYLIFFKELKANINKLKKILDIFDVNIKVNLKNFILSYKGNEKKAIDDDKINNLLDLINGLLKDEDSNIKDTFFILCKINLLIKDALLHFIEILMKNPKITYECMKSDKICENLKYLLDEDLMHKSKKYLEENILNGKYELNKRLSLLNEQIKKDDFNEEDKLIISNYFCNNKEKEEKGINLNYYIDKLKDKNLIEIYPNYFNFLKNLSETTKNEYLSYEKFSELLSKERKVLDEVKSYIQYKNLKNKKIKKHEFEEDDIYCVKSVKILDKDKIVMSTSDKIYVYDIHNMKIITIYKANIKGEIIILKNKNILFCEENGQYFIILNTMNFQEEQKIPLFNSPPFHKGNSLIELSNGDIAYTNESTLNIYKKINNSYFYSKMFIFEKPKIMQMKDDCFIILSNQIIKYSSDDYSFIKILPNIVGNEHLEKIRDDIYCLYGGETKEKDSNSLLYFIDIEKFEFIYYIYNDYVVKYLCPLFINDYFYFTTEKGSSYNHIIMKLIEYENKFEFIKSDEIEKAKYLHDLPCVIEHSIYLGNNKVIYFDDEEIFLIEFN